MSDSLSRCGIYGIFRIGTDECYIGQSINIRLRWKTHRQDLKCGRHSSRFMQRVYEKHGLAAFEFRVLEFLEDPSVLCDAEQQWIDVLSPCYNHAPVCGSCLGVKHSEETKAKHRARMMGNRYAAGKPGSRRGAKLSDETKKRISDAKRGKPNHARRGLKHSPESILKMSINRRGKGTGPRPSSSVSL